MSDLITLKRVIEDMEDRPRWISVTDRLPLDHQTVLCYSDI